MKFTKDIIKNYSIGNYTYGKPEIVSRWGGDLQIGKFCSIANNVKIFLAGNHRVDWVTTYPFPRIFEKFQGIKGAVRAEGKTIIGNDVWIADGATILPGVVVSDGAVIGSRTVVSRNVDPYCIFVGNPGRSVKRRFDDDSIMKLLKIKWWDWDINKIQENIPLLCGEDIKLFIDKHYKGGV